MTILCADKDVWQLRLSYIVGMQNESAILANTFAISYHVTQKSLKLGLYP